MRAFCLLFMGVIDRDLEAQEIQDISSFDEAIRQKFAFDMHAGADADDCVREMVAFFPRAAISPGNSTSRSIVDA